MEDLTGRFPAPLVVGSMSAGNTQANPRSAELAMTARGSPSILPPPPTVDNVVDPVGDAPAPIPVSHPGARDKVTVQSARDGGASFKDAHDIPAASRWKETP